MSDLPRSVHIHEEGPREGFQIESGPISSADKVRLIEALAETGLTDVQCVSFVDPRRVPQMADAEEVAQSIRKKPGVRYRGLWLNLRGLQRAMKTQLDIAGGVHLSGSETFSIRNNGKDTPAMLEEQRRTLDFYIANDIPVEYGIITTAFGCNFEGAIPVARVVERVSQLVEVAAEFGVKLPLMRLADTVGWANPESIRRVTGAVRERHPDLAIGMHLHDTRGVGLANALAALELGVTQFDSSCAGLGGCPFAGHTGAAGNICTEDFVFMCEEMGIDTGVDLDALVGCAQLAEEIVGHPLPGKVMRAGSLNRFRRAGQAAA